MSKVNENPAGSPVIFTVLMLPENARVRNSFGGFPDEIKLPLYKVDVEPNCVFAVLNTCKVTGVVYVK